ncbi:MAG: hypothetical protein Q4E53_07220 [Eubacteriales bacterium]|nr:hypothetical protein [Eubacteriales bacterium]
MPRMTIKTNVFLNKERKYRMMVELKDAIELIPNENGDWLMADFQDESFMLFGENASAPCASVEINVLDKVYDMTEVTILEDVLAKVTEIVGKYTDVEAGRIFAYYRNSTLWAAAGENIERGLLKL